MWSARAKWTVFGGDLQSAVSLTQGSHKEWDDIDETARDQGGESGLILKQSERPSPCEITVDFLESSFFVCLIRVSSTARTCEVYSRKLGGQDHEYVCTVRGKEEETPLPAHPLVPANPPTGLLTQACLSAPQECSPQSPGPQALTPSLGSGLQGGAGVNSNGVGQEEAQESDSDVNGPSVTNSSYALEPLPMQTEHTLREAGLEAKTPLNHIPQLSLIPGNSTESKAKQLHALLTPAKPTLGSASKPHLPAPSVPFYTCYIKLARGPAFTSLRFKFLSLQNKAELQLRPIHIYASRGPAAISPLRLTGNSLSALAPLLPALGPLFGSGVSGLPQLPGGLSHLLETKQELVSKPHQGKVGVENGPGGIQGGGVNTGAASGGRAHQGGLPPGLAQLMASIQGMRAGGAHSHVTTGATSFLQESIVKSAGPPFDPLTKFGNALSGLPGSITERTPGLNPNPGFSPEESGSGTERGTELTREMARSTGSASECESAQQATLEAVLRRLDGLEGTCLRIERAVTGALSSFDARLTRLEESDSAGRTGVNAFGSKGVNRTENLAVGSLTSEADGTANDGADSGVTNAVARRG